MRNGLLLALTLAFITALSIAPLDAQTTRATTEDGRQVILKTDGTWSFLTPPANESPNALRFEKSATATLKITAPHGQFAVWIDPRRWRQTKGDEGKISLEATNGKGYALVISDAIPISKGSLRAMALHNAQGLDSNARIVAEETRTVNNREVLCLQMEASYTSIPFTYYGYYYGGSSGNIQLVAYTSRDQFATMKSEFTDLLNGLEISDDPIPDAPQFETISLNEGKIKVVYDTTKWSAPQKDKGGKITLANVKGNGWALIIPDTVSIPLDSFPEFALNNAKGVDPEAKIILREKKTISGQEVWCLKISAAVSTLPFVYYGYYYSGAAGTVQVLTYTTQTNFSDVEKDFSELLNGLQLNPGGQSSPGYAR
jgi:hypothetical protein